MILLFLACIPSVKESTPPAEEDSSDTGVDRSYTLFLATTDYQVGSLASYDVATSVMSDSLLLLASDSAVSADGGKLFVMGRSSEDTVRIYGDSLSAPIAEFSTGSGSNPQDVAVCNGKNVVGLYETASLPVYDDSGTKVAEVDLSDFADSDGTPEPSELYAAPDGFLYVALNQLGADYRADGPGHVLRVDCDRWTVADSWEVTPNASFSVDPLHPERLVITGGNYFVPDYSAPDLDGWLQTLDTSTGTLSDPLLTEADYGKNLGFVSLQDDGSRVIVSDNGYAWTIDCVASDGSSRRALEGNLFVSSGLIGPDGAIWLAVRPGFAEGDSVQGLFQLDPVSCTVDKPHVTALPPGGLAWR